jgi:hypothetical protein
MATEQRFASLRRNTNIIGNVISCVAMPINIIVIIAILRTNILGTHLRVLLTNISGRRQHTQSKHNIIACILLISLACVIDCYIDATTATVSYTFCESVLAFDQFAVRSASVMLASVAFELYQHVHTAATRVLPLDTIVKRLILAWLTVCCITGICVVVSYIYNASVIDIVYETCEPFMVYPATSVCHV